MLIARRLITIVLIVVALGTPLFILIKSSLDLLRVKIGRSRILLNGLIALAIWVVVSFGTMFILFATFFGSAHSEYRMSHGGAPDPSGSDDPTGMIFLLVVIYALAGGGLSYWLLRRAKTSS